MTRAWAYQEEPEATRSPRGNRVRCVKVWRLELGSSAGNDGLGNTELSTTSEATTRWSHLVIFELRIGKDRIGL